MVHRCCEQNSTSKIFCCHGKVVTMAANVNLFNYIIIYFITSQLSLTSHQRSTVALLDTGTPGNSREFTERMPMVGLKLATPPL